MLTQIQLKELIHYCPDTGTFTLLKSDSPRLRTKVPLTLNPSVTADGYQYVMLGKKTMPLHKLAVFYMTGSYPSSKVRVDHKDRNKLNHRWDNIRIVSYGQNIRNQAQVSEKSNSGHTGIHKKILASGKVRYLANIRIDGKLHHLGTFADIEEALMARSIAHEREMAKIGNSKYEQEKT